MLSDPLLRCIFHHGVGSSCSTDILNSRTTALDHCYWVFVRRSTDITSDYPVLKREFQPEKHALWYTIRPFVRRLILTPSDNPVPQTIFQLVKQALCRTLRVKIRVGISRRRIIQILCPDSPTPLSFPVSILLTWNWFERRFFLPPSVFYEIHSRSWVDFE